MSRVYAWGCCALAACVTGGSAAPRYGSLPAHDAHGRVQVVIEVPAGTNRKREYDYERNAFPVEQRDGVDRVVAFLPYPGNYGFVPSTFVDPAEGGDGDALDVLVLAESVPVASVVPVVPIGVLHLVDHGEVDDKLLAVPADRAARILDVADVSELDPDVVALLSSWFTNYKNDDGVRLESIGGAEDARATLERWQR